MREHKIELLNGTFTLLRCLQPEIPHKLGSKKKKTANLYEFFKSGRFPICRIQIKNNDKLSINYSRNCLNCSKWISNKHRNAICKCGRMWVLTTANNIAKFSNPHVCSAILRKNQMRFPALWHSSQLATESIPSIASCSHPKQAFQLIKSQPLQFTSKMHMHTACHTHVEWMKNVVMKNEFNKISLINETGLHALRFQLVNWYTSCFTTNQ